MGTNPIIPSNVRLNESDIEELRKETCFDQQTMKTYYEGFLKDVPDGKLTCQKFIEVYKVSFPANTADKICGDIFAAYDVNQDGIIDFRYSNKVTLKHEHQLIVLLGSS